MRRAASRPQSKNSSTEGAQALRNERAISMKSPPSEEAIAKLGELPSVTSRSAQAVFERRAHELLVGKDPGQEKNYLAEPVLGPCRVRQG